MTLVYLLLRDRKKFPLIINHSPRIAALVLNRVLVITVSTFNGLR
jgi:hypothetical protein